MFILPAHAAPFHLTAAAPAAATWWAPLRLPLALIASIVLLALVRAVLVASFRRVHSAKLPVAVLEKGVPVKSASSWLPAYFGSAPAPPAPAPASDAPRPAPAPAPSTAAPPASRGRPAARAGPVRRPEPALSAHHLSVEAPLPALYACETPVSMAKMIMSRHLSGDGVLSPVGAVPPRCSRAAAAALLCSSTLLATSTASRVRGGLRPLVLEGVGVWPSLRVATKRSAAPHRLRTTSVSPLLHAVSIALLSRSVCASRGHASRGVLVANDPLGSRSNRVLGRVSTSLRRVALLATSTVFYEAEHDEPQLSSFSLVNSLVSSFRDFAWSGFEDDYSPTAVSTESDPPLPRPPLSEYTPVVMKTLRENQHLFKIVSPVNVDVFESLLVDHPNQPFVRSVIVGLREGFWPWADTQPGTYPDTYDMSNCALKTERERQFVRDQRDAEMAADRFSPSFGSDLLPGMYSMPIHAVPKPQTEKLRLVVNHKAGTFSLNSMIPREAVAGARLDTLKNLGDRLLALRRVHGPDADLVVWKSDVSQAYRRLPMHPLWQVKQIVTIDGERHVDRCNNFGNRGAGRIWTSFMGLVNWVANRQGIPSNLYIDDTFSAELADATTYYPPYAASFPTPQTRTLRLWDRIGVNHERPKQLNGRQLPIVGFEVDANAMTFTMTESKRAELLAGVEDFCRIPVGGRRHPLRKFQQLAGWINWALNVYPLLKPALSHVYEKMSGKTNVDAPIFVNQGVVNDLVWFSRHVRASTGVHLLESLDWDPADADVTGYCDASLNGLGIYFPILGIGYQSKPPAAAPDDLIFYYEAFCVCWCLHEIANLVRANGNVAVRKITIWTDNSNTYNIFNSLRALPLYNEILKSSVDVLIENDFKLRVLLIPGKKNVVADALSRWKNADALAYHPGLDIYRCQSLPHIPFTPPRDALGAAKK
ncbi:hypothetical protein C8R46DRAFT_1362264 [Mycena filopes]|nr:hypothetical protein C8R46DRAFT_1362264 [Mycena filopes]